MSQKEQAQTTRSTTREGGGGDAFGDPFESGGQEVYIQHGVFVERHPVAGRSVAEIRQMLRDRFDIPAEATARIDLVEVSDDAIVNAGVRLEFAHDAGEKGVAAASSSSADGGYTVVVKGSKVQVTSPEGTNVERDLEEVVAEVAPKLDSGGVLPPNTSATLPMPGGFVLVHVTPPRMRLCKWIAQDSQAPFGHPATYRQVKLSLPYVVILAVFRFDAQGRSRLTTKSEAFFSNEPITSMDSRLALPCLLNVSRFDPLEGNPLAWICVQNLELERLARLEISEDERRTKSLNALVRHLFDTGFNMSSDYHEASSWFTETTKAGIDPRIVSVDSWQEASLADPCFAVQVPWLDSGHTVGSIAERMRELHFKKSPLTALDIAQKVLKNRKPVPKKPVPKNKGA